MPSKGRPKLAIPLQRLISKLHHNRIWPSLGPDPLDASENEIFILVRIGLRQKQRHGSRGAGYPHVAVDQDVQVSIAARFVLKSTSEIENRFDVSACRTRRAGDRPDHIMKIDRRPMMRIVGLKSLWFGPPRVEKRKNMSRAASSMIV
jgi:hypothetical protein